MPSLPNKSIKGAAFKKWVVESIDKLIDYLSSTYIQVGHGLKIRRSPSGLVIELDKQPGEPQSAAGGGGAVASGLFPYYPGNVTIPSITPGTTYSADQDFWLIGSIQQSASIPSAELTVKSADGLSSTYIPLSSSTTATDPMSYLVCIPVPANRKFFLNSTLPLYACSLGAYGTTSNAVNLTTYS